MKHEFAVLGVFLGVGVLVIGFQSFPHGNLSANISANVPTNQLADLSASANADGGVAVAAATDTTSVALVESADSAPSSTPAVVAAPDASATTTPDPAPASTPPAQSAPTPPPQPPIPLQPTFSPDSPATSTVATATITVTPTVPAPPSAPAQPPQAATPRPSSPNDLALPYGESSFGGDANWQAVWGVKNTTFAGSLDLSAGPGGTGGAVYLKNSGTWANYTMNATLDWLGGKSIGLIANYNDASNYVTCEYAKTGPGVITMQLAQYVNGNEIFLAPGGASVTWNGNGSNLALSVKVNGTYGACSFNGQTVSSDAVGPGIIAMSAPGAGGIGFNISDPAPTTSEIIVKQISVASN